MFPAVPQVCPILSLELAHALATALTTAFASTYDSAIVKLDSLADLWTCWMVVPCTPLRGTLRMSP
jgi:hypothetical protein